MQDGIGETSSIRLAIAPGVPSRQLSALLALQREEEPEVKIALSEVSGDALMVGLQEGRYDAGLALADAADASLRSQPLWREEMVVAMPLRYPLLNKAVLTLDDVVDYPVFRWQDEICPLLDQQLTGFLPEHAFNVQHVTSFDLLAIWIAAGYGVGISAHSRIKNARAWDIYMRPLANAACEITTYLVQPATHCPASHERLKRRALKIKV